MTFSFVLVIMTNNVQYEKSVSWAFFFYSDFFLSGLLSCLIADRKRRTYR